MEKRIDISGSRFGLLTVDRFDSMSTKREARWLCRCDCGGSRVVIGSVLRRGVVKDCGCQKKPPTLSHGLSKTQEYKILCGMIYRCENEDCKQYPYYGGRGISVCSRWRNSIENFIADMGNRPSKSHSIDRIDVNGNYEPGNCRWSVQKEQCRNRTTSVLYEYNGLSKTLPEWSEVLGIKLITMYKRISAGKTGRDIFIQPKPRLSKRD